MQEIPQQRRTNDERSQSTRGALVKAARSLFVRNGFAGTSTPEIVKAAGITRGALYHHFADKTDLFRAVVHNEFEAVARQIDRYALQEDVSAIDALLFGSRGYLSAMREPGRVQLMLIDAPAVLGRQDLDAIDRETSADTLRNGLRAAMTAGEIRTLPLDALTAQLSALFDRAAMAIAQGDALEDHLAVIEAIIRGLERNPIESNRSEAL
ncbi:MAG: TetR/AcrR family transcriptional regulator [Pseudomonadota bacterium]